MARTLKSSGSPARKSRKRVPVIPDEPVVAKQTSAPGKAGAYPTAIEPSIWPQSYEYPLGENTQIKPRAGMEISFKMLRSMAKNCDLVRVAVQMRKDQIRGLRWDVTVKPGYSAQ